MSRGPGHVQCGIAAAFAEEPNRAFRVCELAAIVYAGEPIAKRHLNTVDRALRRLAPQIGLIPLRSRITAKKRPWANKWVRLGRAIPSFAEINAEIG